MHIPHNVSHPAGMMQPSAVQTSSARKPADKRLRKNEDSFDSLLDVVILSEDGQEDRKGGDAQDGRG